MCNVAPWSTGQELIDIWVGSQLGIELTIVDLNGVVGPGVSGPYTMHTFHCSSPILDSIQVRQKYCKKHNRSTCTRSFFFHSFTDIK